MPRRNCDKAGRFAFAVVSDPASVPLTIVTVLHGARDVAQILKEIGFITDADSDRTASFHHLRSTTRIPGGLIRDPLVRLRLAPPPWCGLSSRNGFRRGGRWHRARALKHVPWTGDRS